MVKGWGGGLLSVGKIRVCGLGIDTGILGFSYQLIKLQG